LTQQLAARLSAMECPGALVGIFPDHGRAQHFALGVSDVNTKQPMNLNMRMHVGSVMKPFLGAVLLQLCDEKKLSLDDPVSRYVDGVPHGEAITLRMLGNNTSGLFNTIENKDFQLAIMKDPAHEWTTPEILEYTFVKRPYFAPAKGWRYSNTNAVLIGMCIEKVTGNRLAEEIDRRICQPLGLRHTLVPPDGVLPDPHPSAYRNGYPDKVIGYGNVFYDVSNFSSSWTNAAGNLCSTLEDLGRALKPLATGQLLSAASKSELFHWIDTGHDGVEYGILIARREGGVGHTGDVPGFNAYFMYFAELETGIVVLTNLSNNKDGTMPAEELAKIVRGHVAESRQ
jgi:D-alanyl-D-alanine carboxypeptidase